VLLARLAGRASLGVALALALPLIPGPAAAAEAPDPLAGYLADLERSRRLPPEEASGDRLRVILTGAEDHLVRGDGRAAASALFAVLESPRYLPFKDTPAYQQAELVLGRALLRGRAFQSAERYLLRAVARGPGAAYFVPAHRALVDVALETRQIARLLPLLEGLTPAGNLPPDSRAEQAYLRGRLHYQTGALAEAEAAFTAVPRSSRLYAGAAYFRGLVAARRGAFGPARGAFCEILPGRGGQSLAFNIDGRYYQLQDLARLALGRIAHEQDRHDEAYYFYFSVPEDSDRLAEALFEAAWSMYQKGEVRAARAFVEAFDQTFPASRLRPEVALLRANIALRTCAFDRARAEAAALAANYLPIQRRLAEAAASPERARALAARLVARDPELPLPADEDGRLLALLELDDSFAELLAMRREIEADEAEARLALAGWGHLQATLAGAQAPHRAASSPEAAALLEEVEATAALAVRDPELSGRAQNLLLETALTAYPAEHTGPYAAEEAGARELLTRLGALRAGVDEAAMKQAAGSFRALDEKLRALFRQSRLVHIDAVVGRKKRLEIEIANLRSGRWGAELFAKLRTEGTIGDDEEYWPFEGEYWADEYENYR
jgi:hypothetical protein